MGHFRGLYDVLFLKLGGGYTQFVTSLYTAYKYYESSLRKIKKARKRGRDSLCGRNITQVTSARFHFKRER